MSTFTKGALLSLGAAFFAALFLIPFKAAGQLTPRDGAVLAVLLCAAGLNTVTAFTSRSRRRGRMWDRTTLLTAGALGVLTAIGNVAVGEALARLDAGLTSVLQQTQVLFVAAAAFFFLGERITLRFMIGAIIALAGFAVAQSPDGGALRVGMLFAIASALAFGMMHVITRKVIDRIDPIWVNALRLWLAVVILASLIGPVRALSGLGARAWFLCFAAAFVGPYLGRICIMYAVRYIPASQSALLVLFAPVFAFALGFIAFGSIPGPLDVVGAALILAGIALPILEIAAQRGDRTTPALPGDQADSARPGDPADR